ncbi:MAG: pyruvate synthase subunit beta, partial [Thermoprotei archaeon]
GPSRGLLNKEKRKHVIEYLKLQGRFRHISKEDIEILQEYIDNKWEEIKSLIGRSK